MTTEKFFKPLFFTRLEVVLQRVHVALIDYLLILQKVYLAAKKQKKEKSERRGNDGMVQRKWTCWKRCTGLLNDFS